MDLLDDGGYRFAADDPADIGLGGIDYRSGPGQFTDTSYSRSADDPATTYDEIMSNVYVGWSDAHEQKLNEWLQS